MPANATHTLTLRVTLVNPPAGAARLRGPAVQGPPAARFLYGTSGTRAGDFASPYNRRAKVPLKDIPVAQLLAQARPVVLSAEIAGTAKDGGPAAASVPLLKGWTVVDAARTNA